MDFLPCAFAYSVIAVGCVVSQLEKFVETSENNCVAKIYRIDMEPGAEYTGSSQGKKTRAYISVLEGEVKIRCGEEAYLVGKEDVFCLEMDRQHSYRNDTAKRISLICFFLDCHKRY